MHKNLCIILYEPILKIPCNKIVGDKPTAPFETSIKDKVVGQSSSRTTDTTL